MGVNDILYTWDSHKDETFPTKIKTKENLWKKPVQNASD